MQLERVKYELDGSVAIITINHPPVNALGKKTLQDLDSALDEAIRDQRVKAVVLTGEGRFFVAGADIKEINTISSEDEGKKLALLGQRIFNKIEGMRKPVVAAINGACLGGGMELAMACHLRIAAESAKLGQPEINLGLIPGYGGTQRLARLTNKAIALEWILTGDQYSADQAFRIGVVNRVVASDRVVDEAKQLAKIISSKGKIAIAKSIEAIYQGIETTLEQGLEIEANLFGEICMTEDKKEGVQAFLEKRTPNFKDK
ncbi:enoyl-CoA hydratase [Vulcanibacillus modesticaldus]|uniref:Enoyl-CoA hydratase n=1 Tax=Vulcanibacillus modesticaldus TaxID=337097 RepID=A0A1D2YS86_9BACI|nr:enoyl-CoA hydratase [Vulcanibacillus modesticaldus]OEF96919.1 enoyl-CoA hydratase [Vulcanibacillus modesticaldus]